MSGLFLGGEFWEDNVFSSGVAVPLSQVTLEAIGKLSPWGYPELPVVLQGCVLGPVWGCLAAPQVPKAWDRLSTGRESLSLQV